jgi:hypothetical protein
MHRFLKYIILFIAIHFHAFSFAQDEVILLSGKTIEGKLVNIQDDFITIETKKGNKTLVKNIETYRVFSILYGDGYTKILYTKDTLIGNDFTVEEMQYFVWGERDALRGYRTPVTTVAGFATGLAGGVFAGESFLVILVPFAYTGIQTLPKIRINKKTVSDLSYLNHEPYLMGYERIARSKKIQNALKGSIAGMLTGIAAIIVYNQIEKEQ